MFEEKCYLSRTFVDTRSPCDSNADNATSTTSIGSSVYAAAGDTANDGIVASIAILCIPFVIMVAILLLIFLPCIACRCCCDIATDQCWPGSNNRPSQVSQDDTTTDKDTAVDMPLRAANHADPPEDNNTASP